MQQSIRGKTAFPARQLILALALTALCSLTGRAGERVAILAGDESAQPVADLLTAELSSEKQVALVERAEIDRVLREQTLSAAGHVQQPLHLASLLRADGLMILENVALKEGPALSARLVASGSGVILGTGVFALRPGKPQELALAVAARFRPLWPKLGVPLRDAIPLSLLNLRSPLQSAEGEAMESQLIFLLSRRLSRHPRLFVLERWQLAAAAWEKSLTPLDDSPFWNGSYLIDGEIDAASTSLKVKVYLRPPSGGPIQSVELTGEKNNPEALADALAARLAALLVKGPSEPVAWNPAEESEQYMREAGWALQARLYSVARAAAEASWALGNRAGKLLELRVNIESALAFPPRGLDDLFHFGPNGYVTDAIDPGTLSARLQNALRGLAILRESILAGNGPKKTTKETVALGSAALLSGSRLLRNAWERGQPVWELHREALAELRQSLRATAAELAALKTSDEAEDMQPFYLVAADYLTFWHERPAVTLTATKALLAKRFTGVNREHLFCGIRRQLLQRQRPLTYVSVGSAPDCWYLPWLVGWHGEMPDELTKSWQDFVASLADSTDFRESIDGHWLRVADEVHQRTEEPGPAEIRLADRVWQARDELLDADLAYPYLWAALSLPDRRSLLTSRDYRLRWLRHYLQHAKRTNLLLMGIIWKPESLHPDEAQEVYRLWEDFKKRVPDARHYKEAEAQLLRKFPDLAPSAPAGSTVPKRLAVKRFWYPPELREPVLSSVHAPVWSHGLLWLSSNYLQEPGIPGRGPITGSRLYGLELPAFRVVERIDAPHGVATWGNYGQLFIDDAALVIATGNAFHRLDRRSGRWTALPFPPRDYTAAWAEGGEVVAAYSATDNEGESGILRWSTENGQATVLASSRRRPALGRFDDCPGYRVGGLFPGPNGAVGAVIDQKGYLYDFRAAAWKPMLPGKAGLYAEHCANGTLLLSEACGIGWLPWKERKIKSLFGSRFPLAGEASSAPDVPKTIALHNDLYSRQPLAFGAGKLWALRMREETGTPVKSLVLDVFEPTHGQVAEIPLTFAAPEEANAIQRVHTRGGDVDPIEESGNVTLIAADQGLVFWVPGATGVWFLPIEDIAPFLDEK
jgi:hypothetical protein